MRPASGGTEFGLGTAEVKRRHILGKAIAVGLMVSEWFRVRHGEGERRALISAGAGAGLAAAFNAPLAGLVFVLEELQGSFTPVVFVAAFLTSVTGDVVGRLLAGEMPVLSLPAMPPPTVHAVPVALVLGAAFGLGGVIFNRALLKSLDLFENTVSRTPFRAGALAGLCVGAAGWISPLVSGSGSALTEEALAGRVAISVIPVFLLARFFLTMLSYSSGAAGGIFAPILVIGSLGGFAIGTGAHQLAPTLAVSPPVFAVLGMGALLTSTIRAPLTSIVLMVELTGEYRFMLPLLASCLAAYGVAEWCKDVPIYEALRERARRKAESKAALARS
jgi:CIC family chloride channel protein